MKPSQRSLSQVVLGDRPMDVFEACHFGGFVKETVLTHHRAGSGIELTKIGCQPHHLQRESFRLPLQCAPEGCGSQRHNPPVLLLQVRQDSLQFPSFLALQRNQDLGRASGLAQGGLLVQTLAVVLD